MNISKFTISQETLSKVNKMYTNEQKRLARFEGIKRLLEEKGNEPVSAHELYNAAGYITNTQKGIWKAASFIQNAKKNGILKKLDEGRKSRYELDLSKIDPKNRVRSTVVNTTEEELNKSATKNNYMKALDKVGISVSNETADVDNVDDTSCPGNKTEQYEVNIDNDRCFSFEITIHEKKEHGYRKLGTIDMTEVPKQTMTELVNNFIRRI